MFNCFQLSNLHIHPSITALSGQSPVIPLLDINQARIPCRLLLLLRRTAYNCLTMSRIIIHNPWSPVTPSLVLLAWNDTTIGSAIVKSKDASERILNTRKTRISSFESDREFQNLILNSLHNCPLTLSSLIKQMNHPIPIPLKIKFPVKLLLCIIPPTNNTDSPLSLHCVPLNVYS